MNTADWIRCSNLEQEILVEVRTISWLAPHTPKEDWHIAERIPKNPGASPSSIAQIQKSIISDARFFRTCSHCSQLQPSGYFIDENLCHECAEKGGIVF